MDTVKLICLSLVMGAGLFAQNPNTAIYPGGIAGDKDMGVQVNHIQTSLTGSLSAGGTTATVSTCTGMKNYTLVAIDAEILLQCACSAGTMSFGYSACPNVDGRARESTTATTHSSGTGVLAYITAGQHNQLSAEIAAIETALSPTPLKVRSCTVAIGLPGSASSVLADDNDAPSVCANDMGTDWTISTVACWADAGSPTITPILTGGSGTSILSGALTCGTASWAAGTVNGSPVVHTFSGAGATCSSTPCTVDDNITTAGGTAKYIVIKIKGTI